PGAGGRAMTQVFQSTCPGCRNVLRIPAAWVTQAMRCKHCGMVLQAKNPPAAATPLPGQLAKPKAVARPVGPATLTPPPATRAPVVAVPTAIPVGRPASARDPFANLSQGGPAQRRPASGGWWKGIALLVCVAAVAVG